jgi:PKD repeat protein
MELGRRTRSDGGATVIAHIRRQWDLHRQPYGDGRIINYAWGWGDGFTTAAVLVGSSAPTAAHTYASKGTYEVTLTVIDNGGATAKSSRSIIATHKCSGGYYLGEQDGQVHPFGVGIGSQALSPPPGVTLLDI